MDGPPDPNGFGVVRRLSFTFEVDESARSFVFRAKILDASSPIYGTVVEERVLREAGTETVRTAIANTLEPLLQRASCLESTTPEGEPEEDADLWNVYSPVARLLRTLGRGLREREDDRVGVATRERTERVGSPVRDDPRVEGASERG